MHTATRAKDPLTTARNTPTHRHFEQRNFKKLRTITLPGEKSISLIQKNNSASGAPRVPSGVAPPVRPNPPSHACIVRFAAPALGGGKRLPQRPAGFPLPKGQNFGPVEGRQLYLVFGRKLRRIAGGEADFRLYCAGGAK